MQRDAACAEILNSADVVFSTLAFSGSATFRKITAPFDTIVIDEAAQALEPSCLVPLTPSIKQVYLVGDPVQLPATVFSQRAVEANFQQSLFKRLQDACYPVHVLQACTQNFVCLSDCSKFMPSNKQVDPVGNPCQLPATTVFSQRAVEANF